MRAWERKYEEYKNGGIDNIINELMSKGISTKEDKEKYKKLTKIKNKMPQIANVIQYRDSLKEDLKKIDEEVRIRIELIKASKTNEKLEEEIEGFQTRYEEINKELKNSKLESDKRVDLESEKASIAEKMSKAQDERNNAEEKLSSGMSEKRELSKVSSKEIRKEMLEIQTKISKCNLVANNLLNGLNWEQIDMKLDNWKDKKFTSRDGNHQNRIEVNKKETMDKLNNSATSRDSNHENKTEVKETIDELNNDTTNNLDGNKYQTILEDTKYDNNMSLYKYPIILGIRRKIRNLFKYIKNKFSPKSMKEEYFKSIEENLLENEPENEPEKTLENEPEYVAEKTPEEIEIKKEEDKSFKEYIKEIAEKGMDGLAKEEEDARQEELKKKLAKMRAKNRAIEAGKFGKKYAEQSDFRKKDDDNGIEI